MEIGEWRLGTTHLYSPQQFQYRLKSMKVEIREVNPDADFTQLLPILDEAWAGN